MRVCMSMTAIELELADDLTRTCGSVGVPTSHATLAPLCLRWHALMALVIQPHADFSTSRHEHIPGSMTNAVLFAERVALETSNHQSSHRIRWITTRLARTVVAELSEAIERLQPYA